MQNFKQFFQTISVTGCAVLVVLLLFLIPAPPTHAEDKGANIIVAEKLELPAATVGKEYNIRLPHDAKEKNATWKKIQGKELPKGLGMTETGYLVGTPAAACTVKFILEKKYTKDDKTDSKHYEVTLKVKAAPKLDFGATENLRLTAGYELSTASDAKTSQNGYIDFYFSAPVVFGYNEKLQHKRLRTWGNIRFAGTPRVNEKSISQLDSQYFTDLSKLKLNEIASSLELLAGLDYTLFRANTNGGHVTVGLVLALGMIYSPPDDAGEPTIYKYTEAVKERYAEDTFVNNPDDPAYFAFVLPTRDPFYFQCYGGLRFKTYSNKEGDSAFPIMADVMVGFNKAACGHRERPGKNPVVRLEGFLPFKPFKLPMYLQGTLVAHLTKIPDVNPLYLDKAPDDAGMTLTSPELLQIVLPETKRTYFRISVGIDLVTLLKSAKSEKKK
ncbi:MAG: hypothetical protein GY765_06340 [bacterium]|nr:hypothetical protein [bacterium]